MAKAIISKEKTLIKQDAVKWLTNALIFSAPAILVLLGDLADLVPNNAAYGALMLAVYGMVVDGFKKWVNENKYK